MILIQCLLEATIDCDNSAPTEIQHTREKWSSELPTLQCHVISKWNYLRNDHLVSVHLHSFSDALESAYNTMVYLWTLDDNTNIHSSLVIAKLELCGEIFTVIAPRLLHPVSIVLIKVNDTFAISWRFWTLSHATDGNT